MITASTPFSITSKSSPTTQSRRVPSSGNNEAGPHTRTSPVRKACSACKSLRATRECFTSPTIKTFIAEKSGPLACRKVSMSSSPWVGWLLRPSPALISTVPGNAERASAATAPSVLWRTTKPCTPIASSVLSVSRSLSPLVMDAVDASKLSRSAPSRWIARLKLQRVRVDASKNSVHTALPASTPRIPVPPCACSANASARCSTASSTPRGMSSRVSRCFSLPASSSCSLMPPPRHPGALPASVRQ